MEYLAEMLVDCSFSIRRVVIGLLLAIVVGIVMGFLRSYLPYSWKKNKIVNFIFDFPRFPPPIAWVPLVVFIIPYGELAAYLIVFIGAFPPVFLNTYEGIENISTNHINTARSMELNLWNYYYGVIFKAALPQIFIGVRVAVGMGWMSVIAAEMLSDQGGLGYAIQLYTLHLQFNLVLANIFVIGVIGFFLNQLVLFLEKQMIPWHYLGGEND